MRLREYLRRDLVATDLRAGDVEEALAAIAQGFVDAGAAPAAAPLERALGDRERAHTTAMGHAFALPHATIEGLSEPLLAVHVAPEPVPFGPPDAEPVRLFFTLLSPPGRQREHIKLLARICRLVRHPGFVESVTAGTDPDDVLERILDVDEQHV